MAGVKKNRHLLKGTCKRCGEHFKDTDFVVKHKSDKWHLECYIDMKEKDMAVVSNEG